MLHLITFLVIAVIAFGALCWVWWGESWLQAIYEGRFYPFIDDLVAYHRSLNPGERTLAFYHKLTETMLLRLGLLWFITMLLLWLCWPQLKKRIRRFLTENVSPEQLAVFRILVFGVLLLYPNYTAIFRMSTLPPELLVPPPGWSGLLAWLPPTPLGAQISGSLFLLGCLGALVGYRTRFMAVLATLSGIWFLGIPQFYGKIDHYHHLLWFSALAAVSPVSDRFSVDAWRKPYTIVRPAGDYARPLYFLLALMAVIYFFAGWWKLIGGGMAWLWGDAAFLQLETQALRTGVTTPVWLSENDLLKHFLGLSTVLLELGWGYAMLSKRFRPWVLAAALFFHGSVYWLMQINFWQLPVFYLVFLPWGDLLPHTSLKIQNLYHSRQQALRWVGGSLLVINGLFGLAHFDSWPFAVYPSFGNPPEAKMKRLVLYHEQGGALEAVDLYHDSRLRAWLPKTRLQGLQQQLILTRDESRRQQKVLLLLPFYFRQLNIGKDQPFLLELQTIHLQTGQLYARQTLARSVQQLRLRTDPEEN